MDAFVSCVHMPPFLRIRQLLNSLFPLHNHGFRLTTPAAPPLRLRTQHGCATAPSVIPSVLRNKHQQVAPSGRGRGCHSPLAGLRDSSCSSWPWSENASWNMKMQPAPSRSFLWLFTAFYSSSVSRCLILRTQ